MSETIDAREAARLLGVQVRTLYAYVSRGQLESLPGPGRAKRYRRADIERLRRNRQGVDAALHWGQPVLESAITRIAPSGPVYRGRSALALAERGARFEAVAELLWTGALPDGPVWPLDAQTPDVRTPPDADPLARLALLVPWLAVHDPGRFNRRPSAVIERARRIIRRMAHALGAPERDDRGAPPSVAEGLAAGWAERPEAAAALNAALILWADHELNVSSFAARVAASAQADVYACISAGLAALSGPRHGTHCERVGALVAEIDRPERAEAVVHARIRRGESLPGFGHPLYPKGDPRAPALLAVARSLGPHPRVEASCALVDVAARELEAAPNIDLGLIALTEALGLPAREAPGLIAVGRAAGWVAHALEQYASGELIRPRARFTGPSSPG